MSYKEEYIAKYGEEAYNRIREASRLYRQKQRENPEQRKKYNNDKKKYNSTVTKWQKEHRKEINERQRSQYNELVKISDQNEIITKGWNYIKTLYMSKYGECGMFVFSQMHAASVKHLRNWKKYINELLLNENSPEMLDIDYLYTHFKDNIKYNLYYGNIQILKFFIPLMCFKVYNGLEFTEKEIEMIKYFETFENKTKVKPISYKSIFLFIAPEIYQDIEKCMKLMLLNNLIADFMRNRTKYVTDKKLY